MKSRILFFVIFALIAAFSANAQTEKPRFESYKGVSIGMPIEKSRATLGNPKEKAEGQDFYQFTENESIQVFYDATQTVTAVMVTFTGGFEIAPKPKEIFGEDVAANADGSIFKMVRYPKAGFWISYNRTATLDSMISIAMQKIN